MDSKVYIKGQIGTTYKEDGTIDVKGVELQDVISQIEPIKNNPIIEVYINSMGGLVEEGTSISNYLSSFSNVVTIADEVCMSIATKIHLSVPLDNRKITQGTIYTIHQPLITDFSGNADDMVFMSKVLKPIETEMIKMYVKATGLSQEAIVQMMKKETSLTSEEVVKMGFASEVIYKYKAVAMVSKVKNENKNKMSKFLNAVNAFMDAFKSEENKGREAFAMVLKTDKGDLETPFADLMIGDPAMIDGSPASAGEYTLEDGTIVVVDEAGVIVEIKNASPEINELLVAMQVELDNAKTELATLKAQFDETKKENETLKTEQSEVVAMMGKLKNIQSRYVPVVNNSQGKKSNQSVSFREEMESRKNNYKTKK